MAFTQFTKDMEIIAKLSDTPNVDDGMTADQLKAKFDEGGKAIKEYINGTLLPECEAPITADRIATGAVTASKLGVSAVTSGKINDGSVTNPKIADGSVTNAKIADGAVTAAKLATKSVPSSRLGDGAVLTEKIAAGAVTTEKFATDAVAPAAAKAARLSTARQIKLRDSWEDFKESSTGNMFDGSEDVSLVLPKNIRLMRLFGSVDGYIYGTTFPSNPKAGQIFFLLEGN